MPQERATRLHLPANIALSERARQTPVCLNALRFLSDLVTTLGKKTKQLSLACKRGQSTPQKCLKNFVCTPQRSAI